MNNLPVNLFIPGASKSGTSSLSFYLNQHSKIYISSKKEPHFFSHDKKYFSENERNKYKSLFEYPQQKNQVKFKGEASTGYFVFPNVVNRIKKNTSNPKFIFILRNPIDKIHSHYWWLRGEGLEVKSFRKAILSSMDYDQNNLKPIGKGRYDNYFFSAKYYTNIKKYYEHFPKDNIIVIATEELKFDLQGTMQKVFEFLGLEHERIIETNIINQTKILRYPKLCYFLRKIKGKKYLGLKKLYNKISQDYVEKNHELSAKDREWLKVLLYEEVKNLKLITGKNFKEWSDFNI